MPPPTAAPIKIKTTVTVRRKDSVRRTRWRGAGAGAAGSGVTSGSRWVAVPYVVVMVVPLSAVRPGRGVFWSADCGDGDHLGGGALPAGGRQGALRGGRRR